ncbi:acyl-CoA dehydrogenase family protein [Pseudomonas sp. NPDC089734]|uniref:acyl-CoA dehydrogenase family protein n=1 Tax=Pseudomonas sp. NPDC089734 TaxID=3364469 RepID=UPI0037F14AB5
MTMLGALEATAALEFHAQPSSILEIAEGLKDSLRKDQDISDAQGTYSPTLHDFFKEHGFYKLLLPKKYGGLQLDLADYYRIMIAISRGHPSIGWNLTLGAAHSLIVASHWPKEVQDEVFGNDSHFIAPHRAFPGGTSRRVKGGFIVDGVFNYCTGITYSTHAIVNTLIHEEGAPPLSLNCIVPRRDYTILDDWGNDKTLGMRASGSNSIRLDSVFVPERMATPFHGFFANQDVTQGTHGTRLHQSPLYLGYLMLPYHANLLAPIIGAAQAALDEYKELLLTRSLPFDPALKRFQDTNYQRAYGQARTLTEAAQATLLHMCEQHKKLGERWQATTQPITIEENIVAWGVLQQAGRQACEAVELLFRTAGSTEARSHSRLLRYFSDVQMYRGHVGSQWETFAPYVARAELGLPLAFLGL